MLKQFLDHLRKENLYLPNKRFLLAISGGKDSMAMLDLFIKANLNIGVAHVNHTLRDQDSTEDALLVKTFCENQDISYHELVHDVKGGAESLNMNLHAYARNLRYDFFNSIAKDHHFDFIATAHHRNDALESVLINFAKGSGLAGLSGIAPVNGNIVRPMMFCNRMEIDNYVNQHNIIFREDKSNSSYYYLRNRLRHLIMPTLRNIFPSIEESGYRTIENVRESNMLLLHFAKQWISENCYFENDIYLIPKSLEEISGSTSLLFYILGPKGFTRDQCINIIQSIDHIGAKFVSKKFILLIDRNYLMLNEVRKVEQICMKLNMGRNIIDENKSIVISTADELHNSDNKNIAYFDATNFEFPLTIRNWQNGDRFAPLGMDGRKQKVKDFLINNKIDLLRKKDILVVENNEEICWIVGYRESDNYKVTSSSSSIIKMEFINS